jgi:hypothetical protein
MTSPPIAYAARLAYQNKRAQEEHWDLTSEQHCFARAMTADMLGLLRTVAAHGGIKISKQGGNGRHSRRARLRYARPKQRSVRASGNHD